MLVDTHVHLNSKKYEDDLPQVISRAQEAGVELMIVVGFDHETNLRAIELAEKYLFIYATVGFHPTDARYVKESEIGRASCRERV